MAINTNNNPTMDRIPDGQLLAHGWRLANDWTKDYFPGAVFMRQIGGSGTPYATYDFTLVKAGENKWIPIHGDKKMAAVASPEEAAFALTQYWLNLPDGQKRTVLSYPNELVNSGWTQTSNWKWSREVGKFEVELRSNEGGMWEVIVAADGDVKDTPFESSSVVEAVEMAKAQFEECVQLAAQQEPEPQRG